MKKILEQQKLECISVDERNVKEYIQKIRSKKVERKHWAQSWAC